MWLCLHNSKYTKQLKNGEPIDLIIFYNSYQITESQFHDTLRGLAYFSKEGFSFCSDLPEDYIPKDLQTLLPDFEKMHKQLD